MRKKLDEMKLAELRAVGRELMLEPEGHAGHKASWLKAIEGHIDSLNFVGLVEVIRQFDIKMDSAEIGSLDEVRTPLMNAKWEIPTAAEPDRTAEELVDEVEPEAQSAALDEVTPEDQAFAPEEIEEPVEPETAPDEIEEPVPAPRRRNCGLLLAFGLGSLILLIVLCLMVSVVSFAPARMANIANKVFVVVGLVEEPETPIVEEVEEREFDLHSPPGVGDTIRANGQAARVVLERLVDRKLSHVDLRDDVDPGDVRAIVIRFDPKVVGSISIIRAVADDRFLLFKQCTSTECIDLLPYLRMVRVTETEPTGSIRAYMVARGMEDEEQKLMQNSYAVQLNIAGEEEVWLEIVVEDDPSLGVKSGGLIAFSPDTDPYTWIPTEEGFELSE